MGRRVLDAGTVLSPPCRHLSGICCRWSPKACFTSVRPPCGLQRYARSHPTGIAPLLDPVAFNLGHLGQHTLPPLRVLGQACRYAEKISSQRRFCAA